MSDYIKTHIVSFLQTFVAALLTIIVTVISAIPAETLASPETWSAAAISAVVLAAARTALKMATAPFIPTTLGGTKVTVPTPPQA